MTKLETARFETLEAMIAALTADMEVSQARIAELEARIILQASRPKPRATDASLRSKLFKVRDALIAICREEQIARYFYVEADHISSGVDKASPRSPVSDARMQQACARAGVTL
jgi:hypothetical protein